MTYKHNEKVKFGDNDFTIERIDESYIIAVPHDPHWMSKILHEMVERDAAVRNAKEAKK